MPVTFENDAHALAYGEFWVGAWLRIRQPEKKSPGTGIGVGIILDDMVIRRRGCVRRE